MPATTRVPDQLQRDIRDTLAQLRWDRMVDPRHFVRVGERHSGCHVCTSQRRLDWLLDRISRGKS